MTVKSKLGIIGIAAVAVLALLVAALTFYPPNFSAVRQLGGDGEPQQVG